MGIRLSGCGRGVELTHMVRGRECVCICIYMYAYMYVYPGVCVCVLMLLCVMEGRLGRCEICVGLTALIRVLVNMCVCAARVGLRLM